MFLKVVKIICKDISVLLFFFLSFSSHVTQKLQGVYKCSMYEMNAILSKIFLFWYRALCKLWLASYVPNTHHGLFSIHHFVCISSVIRKPQDVCTSTTHQMTPVLPLMLCFMSKAAKQLQLTSYGPRANITVLLFCAQVRMTTKLRAPTTVL